VERLGGKAAIPVDIRIISATNRDIEAMVRDGLFRGDLYYRLNVIPIKLPPLRERRSDIPLLVDHFIRRYNRMFKKNIQGMDDEAMQLIMQHDWPGNVRELNNLIEYLENIVDSGKLGVADLPVQFQRIADTRPDAADTLRSRLEAYEKRLLQSYLQNCDATTGMRDLAQQLGVSRATLYRKLAAYGLSGCLKNETLS
jgi:transcriptional regulator with PAS, ATPase and Fis domain